MGEPFRALWRVLEHGSATVAFKEYKPLLRKARWLLRHHGDVIHKGRTLLTPIPLLPRDPQPCFASNKAEQDFYDQIWFSRIRSLVCRA